MVSQTTDATKDSVLESQEPEVVVEEIKLETEHLETEKTTEEIVKEYFSDTPVMADVAFCESRYQQFDKFGNVIRGRANRLDVGVFQINEKYHAGAATRLGLNLYTLEGNMAYAKYLYETQGTDPWVHSSKCWNTVREIALNNKLN